MENNEMIFENRGKFRDWLTQNGETSSGIWLIFGKTKDLKTLSANEALLEALCFGWIDGQMESIDEVKYRKYFSHRRGSSNWSEKNKTLAQELIEKGIMAPQGLEEVSRAKQNGKWENSKRYSVDEQDIQNFADVIKPYPAAYANLMAMSHSIQRTYTLFYLDAKSEQTRLNRLEKIVGRLEKGLGPM